MRRELLAFWLIYGVLLAFYVARPVVVGWDPAEYLAYGKWLFSGGRFGFETSYRPPVWPLLLGTLWKLGFPMPLTMKAATFLIYALVPLVPFALFEDSKRYAGLVIASHPIFASWTHLPLSHPLAVLLFMLAYSVPGPLAGAFAALSGLTRFTYLLSIPFVCWKDRRKWAAALLVLSVNFGWAWASFGHPLSQLRAASAIINDPTYLWFWEQPLLFYAGILAASHFLSLGLLSRSRYTLAFLASFAYFTFLPHKEPRFFIDTLPYLSAATAEGFHRLPLVIAALNLLFLPFAFTPSQLPPEAWGPVPEGATVVGMTPEINAYKDVDFRPWFYPRGAPEGEYCIYMHGAIPCSNPECEETKARFLKRCRPLYENQLHGLVVGRLQPAGG